MSERTTRLLQRWRLLESDKSLWHEHYDDLARVMLPQRLGFSSTTIEGERRTEDIFDGTPMQAARGLANAIGGLMRPEGLPTVDMKVEDDGLDNLGEVQEWLSDAENKLKDGFNNPKARFRQASSEKDIDLVVFGTAVVFISEEKNRLLFQSLHLRNATPFFSEAGAAEGIFIKRRLTVRQLVERFGDDKLSPDTQKLIKDSLDTKISVLHAVVPREESRAQALFARDLPIADLWIEIEAKHELSIGGFHEFPFIVPRWDTSSGEGQGRSPGMVALPDSDTLQAMGETLLISGQRAADPPLMAPNDGSFSSLNTFPGGLSYYDVETAVALRGNPFFTLESGTNLPLTRDMQQDTRSQIFAAFFKNILNLPIDGPRMSATEIIQRKEELMREIGPVFGRLETDDTAPTVERVFMIMLRAGAFLPIPEVLQGQNIRFEYDSPVKRIRQQVEAAAAREWAQEMIVLSEFKPEALDLVNVDALGRFSADALGIPDNIVNAAEDVEQIRGDRQEELEAQQEAAKLREVAELAKTGAEAADKAGMVERQTV